MGGVIHAARMDHNTDSCALALLPINQNPCLDYKLVMAGLVAPVPCFDDITCVALAQYSTWSRVYAQHITGQILRPSAHSSTKYASLNNRTTLSHSYRPKMQVSLGETRRKSCFE